MHWRTPRPKIKDHFNVSNNYAGIFVGQVYHQTLPRPVTLGEKLDASLTISVETHVPVVD